MMDELPPGWAIATVGSVAHFIRGVTYSKEHAKRAPAPGFVGVLRATNIGDGLNYGDLVFVPDRFVADEQIVRDGDVVLAMSSGSKSVVGKAAIAKSPQRCGFGAFCGVVRPSHAINHSLLAYYFQTKAYRNAVSEVSKGSNINNLKAEHVLGRPLLIPPKAEQERIVSKIDELFSHIDEGERALERVQKLVERYRQSVLKAAVTGELTREWREKNKDKLESGEALLARILKARRKAWEKAELEKMKVKGVTPTNDQWKQKYKEPSQPDKSALSELPVGWSWVSLDQITARVTDGTHQPPPFASSGIPFLTIQHLSPGVVRWDNVAKWVTPETFAEYTKSMRPRCNDVLYSAVGSYGVAVAVKVDFDFMFQRHIAHIRPLLESVLPDYLELVLNSPGTLAIAHVVARGVAQKTVTLSDLRGFPIPIPSVTEQEQVLEIVAAEQTRLSEVANAFSDSVRASQTLRQGVLKSAFAGTLVSQDPTDEPASVLLKRIAAERGRDNAAPQRGRKKKAAV